MNLPLGIINHIKYKYSVFKILLPDKWYYAFKSDLYSLVSEIDCTVQNLI